MVHGLRFAPVTGGKGVRVPLAPPAKPELVSRRNNGGRRPMVRMRCCELRDMGSNPIGHPKQVPSAGKRFLSFWRKGISRWLAGLGSWFESTGRRQKKLLRPRRSGSGSGSIIRCPYGRWLFASAASESIRGPISSSQTSIAPRRPSATQ